MFFLKKVIVIFGGVSPEHDVSIITGCLALNCVDKTKFDPVPVYVDKTGKWFIGNELFKLRFFKNYQEKKLTRVNVIANDNALYRFPCKKKLFSVYAAINCMHGGNGENGTIGALFELCGIPFTDGNLFSSAVSMDKSYTKILAKGLGVATVPYVKITRADFYKDRKNAVVKIIEKLPLPLIVKPANTGSSIGISVVKTEKELENGLFYAFKFDKKIIVEKFVENFAEINCAAYLKNGEIIVSELEKPILSHDILTFDDKYSGVKEGLKKREFPATVPCKVRNQVRETTRKIYENLEFTSVVRMDYICLEDTVYLNEINSVPGSLSYYLFCDKTSGLTDLLTGFLDEAVKNFLAKKSSKVTFDSNVLSFKGVSLKK